MAFLDWDRYTVGSPTVALNLATPIIDLGSLHLRCLATEKVLLLNTLYSGGLTKGIMRSLFRVDAITGPDAYRYGFSLFQSSANITAAGYAYQFAIEAEQTLSSNTVVFDICTAGLDEVRTRYFSGTPFTRIEGTTIVALELEWAYEPVQLGGTRFILREGHGLNTDFSNLVQRQILEFYPGVGPGNPPFLVTAGGDGLFVTGETTPDSTVLVDLNVDLTTIRSLA